MTFPGNYRRLITVDHTKVVGSSDLTSFGVLVGITDASLKSAANGGNVQSQFGYDIGFYSDSGGTTPLSWEVESYTPTTGALVAWVKLPTLHHSTDDVIYMFYGNASMTTFQSVASGVWDSNFKGVYHLKQPTSFWTPPTRYAGNPIISSGGGGWKDSQLQEPSVLVDPFDATKLIMFYVGMAAPLATGHMSMGRATATVADPYTWTEDPGNPIFNSPSSGTLGTRLSRVLWNPTDSKFYCYSHDDTATPPVIRLHTSTDGFAFTFVGDVLTATGQGRNDGYGVVDADVLREDATHWHMYYARYNDSGPAVLLEDIRYASSSDGVTWTKGGDVPLFQIGSIGTPDHWRIEGGAAIKYGGYYIFVYSQANANSTETWSVGCAYSTSPSSGFVKSGAAPIFLPTKVPSTWDRLNVANPRLFLNGSTWLMFYQGQESNTGSFGVGHWDMGVVTLVGDPLTAFIPSLVDSTANVNHFASVGTAVTGQVGGALSFNGTTQHAGSPVAALTAVDNFTLSAWMRPSNLSQLSTAVFIGADDGATGGAGYGFGLGDGSGAAGAKLQGVNAGVAFLDSGYTFPDTTTRRYVVQKRTSGTTSWRIDKTAAPNTSGSAPDPPVVNTNIGSATGCKFFAGDIDEVRISNVARSNDWLDTEFNNQSSPGTFLTVGSQVSTLMATRLLNKPMFNSPMFNPAVPIALSGTIVGASRANIVSGGRTIILTLTGDTWVASGATFNATRQAIIDGLDSAQSEATGWDAVVKAGLAVTAVVRTSATVVTITLTAFPSYDITVPETITATVPATALEGNHALIASPTFTISGGVATAITLSGPSSGNFGSASANFTVGANGTITGTVIFTPTSSAGTGTFTPTTVSISSGAPTGTFTYTPSSAGARNINGTNNGGLSAPSNVAYTANAVAPSTPVAPVATAGNTTASVALVAPSNGGAAITGYVVTSSPGGGVDSNTGSTALTHVMTGLTNGTPYTFTFTATNSVGTSSASPASNSVTPAVIATAFTLSGPSSGNFGVASTAFTVGANGPVAGDTVVNFTDTSEGGTFTPAFVTILSGQSAADSTVTYTPTSTGVRSINVTGALTSPSAVTYTVSATAPATPSAPLAVSGNTTATIYLSAPSNGGAPITGYVVTSNPGGGVDSNSGSPGLIHVIMGLTNDTAYTFTYRATNSVGQSSASAASNSVTPREVGFGGGPGSGSIGTLNQSEWRKTGEKGRNYRNLALQVRRPGTRWRNR